MEFGGAVLWAIGIAARELTLFAAVGFLIGGIDDLAIDGIWLARNLWRRLAVYSRNPRADIDSLAPPARPGRIAVFIPAWDEAAVIERMLRHALASFDHDDYRLYVGAYPNDPGTIDAVARVAADDTRVRPVICAGPGPTTKADCLNCLWHALIEDERAQGLRFKAIVLHDAEDVVHSAELALFDRLIERFALIQLPVLPLVDRRSRWISGHYCDEFAEAHGKGLVVREALGAAVPSAGVGCALSRAMLEWIAERAGGAPFDATSVTEDYELGLRVAELGGRGVFVRLPGRGRRAMVAVRAHFPATLDEAVRQKARWMTGIALSGWDRLGWRGGLAERWMRLHDRRAPIAALVLAAGYGALLLWAVLAMFGHRLPPLGAIATVLLAINSGLLVWRLALRFGFVTHAYGWREGLRAIPRTVFANAVTMLAAIRAAGRYRRMLRGDATEWDKTSHIFPDAVPAE